MKYLNSTEMLRITYDRPNEARGQIMGSLSKTEMARGMEETEDRVNSGSGLHSERDVERKRVG